MLLNLIRQCFFESKFDLNPADFVSLMGTADAHWFGKRRNGKIIIIIIKMHQHVGSDKSCIGIYTELMNKLKICAINIQSCSAQEVYLICNESKLVIWQIGE